MSSRIRTLKPGFFRSRSLARCSLAARVTFAGLWCEADDHGRGIADVRLIKGAVWPLDDGITPDDIEAHLTELQREHLQLYFVDDERYYAVREWHKHQSAAYRRGEAVYPAPPGTIPHDSARGDVLEGKGREGTLVAGKPARKRDELFEALTEAVGIDVAAMTPSKRGAVNRALAELRTVKATPAEVRARAKRYRQKWPRVSLTASALAKHWDELPPPVNAGQFDEGITYR